MRAAELRKECGEKINWRTIFFTNPLSSISLRIDESMKSLGFNPLASGRVLAKGKIYLFSNDS